MANAEAWQIGAAIGSERAREHRAHKQALSDQELQGKITDLISQRSAILDKLPNLTKGTPEYDEAFNALRQTDTNLRETYHPEKNPGAIQKFGHLLTDHLKLTKPLSVTQGQKRADALAGDEKIARGQAAGIAPSAVEQATTTAKAGAAGTLASVQAAQRDFDKLNPDATPEERQSFLTDLIQKAYGTTIAGNWKIIKGTLNGQPASVLFDSKTRQVRTLNGEAMPPELLATWVPETNTSADANKRADFEAFKREHPEYKGSFEQWVAEESGKGRAAAPKAPNRDDRYIAIEQKKLQGQPLTDDDKAYEVAYDLWTKKTKVDPGVARAAAFGAMRYIGVVDPNNPENVILMRAGDAARAGVNTPASIGFKTDQAITRYMTSGAGGTNINYFNTATDHLALLRQAGEALNNGNIQLFNEYANRFATATGDPAPSNFETVKAAVAGELSKTFKGTGATDSEIADINQTINQAQSPQQIQGAIDYYTSLMGSKVHALQLQYEAGKQGHPNFPGSTPTPSGQTPPTGGKPKDAIGKVNHNGKNYWVDARGNNLGVAP